MNVGDYVYITKRQEVGIIEEIRRYDYVIFEEKSTEYLLCKEHELEYLPRYVFSQDMLRKLIRYEITFKDLKNKIYPLQNYDSSIGYETKPEDILAAYQNFKKVDIASFYDDWFRFIDYDSDLQCDLQLSQYDYEENEIEQASDFLPISEMNIAREIYEQMIDISLSLLEEDVDFQENFPFEDIEQDMASYQNEAEQSILERHYSSLTKRKYINYLKEKTHQEKSNEEELELFVKIVDEFVEQKDKEALRIKAYACYGGNKAYPCDWIQSRDCLLELFKIDSDPYIANTLGYIYYYGRTNNGIPEYEEAYKYFSIGAFYGIFESSYKVADMFFHGYGVPKMVDTARSMYEKVYLETYKYFLKGNDSKFADAALRLGNFYSKQEEYDRAYEYYLQADYAIRKRLSLDYYGDFVVFNGIQKALAKTREIVHQTKKAKKSIQYSLNVLNWFTCEDTKRCKVKLKELVNHVTKMQIEYCSDEQILWTSVEADTCIFSKQIDFYLEGDYSYKIVDKKMEFIYTKVVWEEECYVFYYDQTKVATFQANCIKWKAKPNKNPVQKIRMASVRFSPKGKLYDYLCEGDISVGDVVFVNGGKVEVIEIYERWEDGTGIPIEKYKKVTKHP